MDDFFDVVKGILELLLIVAVVYWKFFYKPPVQQYKHSISNKELVSPKSNEEPNPQTTDPSPFGSSRNTYKYNPIYQYFIHPTPEPVVHVKVFHPCRACEGTGKCKRCGGTGRIYDYGPLSITSHEKYDQACPVCESHLGVCGGCDGACGFWY